MRSVPGAFDELGLLELRDEPERELSESSSRLSDIPLWPALLLPLPDMPPVRELPLLKPLSSPYPPSRSPDELADPAPAPVEPRLPRPPL